MVEKNLRDHGYPDMGLKPIGKPKAEPTGADMECPNCGCQVMKITVDMEGGILKGGKGRGVYMGCPACPFASPAVTSVAT
jgi:hypothetical protein